MLRKTILNILMALSVYAVIILLFEISHQDDFDLIEKEIVNGDTTAKQDVWVYGHKSDDERTQKLLYPFLRYQLLLYQNKATISLKDSLENLYLMVKEKPDETIESEILGTLALAHYQLQNADSAYIFQHKAYEIQRKDAGRMNQRFKELRNCLLLGIILLFSIIITLLQLLQKQRHIIHTNALRLQYMKERLTMSEENMNKSLCSIRELKKSLETQSHRKNQQSEDAIHLKEICSEIEKIEDSYREQQVAIALSSIKNTDVGQKFARVMSDGRLSIRYKDWVKLEEAFTENLPALIYSLTAHKAVTITEKRICMLMLLDIGTLETANLLNLQTSSISSAKKALYEKLSNKKGSAKELKGEIIRIALSN